MVDVAAKPANYRMTLELEVLADVYDLLSTIVVGKTVAHRTAINDIKSIKKYMDSPGIFIAPFGSQETHERRRFQSS